jgi:hypothetical protein
MAADSTSVVVDICVTTEPCPAQKTAWAVLWQLIWAHDRKRAAPSAMGRGLEHARVLNALTNQIAR